VDVQTDEPVMKALLRSPLHRLLDGTLVLLTYTGRKTGKQYTIPIGYFVWGRVSCYLSVPLAGGPTCAGARQ
jgi:hypothetical protein